jgi:NADH-quinone oxidoreductase subunit K
MPAMTVQKRFSPGAVSCFSPTLSHYLVLGAVLFAISIVGIFLNRRNVIILLMAIELMLLAVNMNFHRVLELHQATWRDRSLVVFILTVAAAESAIGLAILVLLFRNIGSIDVEDMDPSRASDGHASLYLVVPLAPLSARSWVGPLWPRLGRSLSHWLCIIGVAIASSPRIVHLARTSTPATCQRQASTPWMQSGAQAERSASDRPADRADAARRDVRVADGARLHDSATWPTTTDTVCSSATSRFSRSAC